MLFKFLDRSIQFYVIYIGIMDADKNKQKEVVQKRRRRQTCLSKKKQYESDEIHFDKFENIFYLKEKKNEIIGKKRLFELFFFILTFVIVQMSL